MTIKPSSVTQCPAVIMECCVSKQITVLVIYECIYISFETWLLNFKTMISFCCLAPGSFFVVESPPKIYKWMAEHTQPLLFVINPIKVVLLKNIATLPSVRVVESLDRLQAFHIPNCRIGIIDVHLIKLACIGKTCDCLGMVNGTNCACVHRKRELGDRLGNFFCIAKSIHEIR